MSHQQESKKFLEYEQILQRSESRTMVITLGGCGEFGMNLTAIIAKKRVYLVDCGVQFAEPWRLGIDSQFVNVEKMLEAFDGVFSYLITHGHEDHIGALPWFLKRWPAPVYATKWTKKLITRKLEQFDNHQYIGLIKEVEAGDRTVGENFSAEWIHVNHSIPMSCALLIETMGNRIFHTGDFKFDLTPVGEPCIDTNRIYSIGQSPIDLMIADSTNSHKRGFCLSESSVKDPILKHIRSAPRKVIVSTFSSNFWRLQTLLEIAVLCGRRTIVAGRGVESTLSIASELGFNFPSQNIIDVKEACNYKDDSILILATGCQGEVNAALPRIVNGNYKGISVNEGDLVLLSSRMIPGNEKSVFNLVSKLKKVGARTITTKEDSDIHVSGHAHSGEIKTLFSLLEPRFYLPVHGSFSHLLDAQNLVEGFPTKCPFISENGAVFELGEGQFNLVDILDTELNYVDSFSKQSLDYETMRERHRIGEQGLAIIKGTMNSTQPDKTQLTVNLIGISHHRYDDWSQELSQFLEGQMGKFVYENEEELNEELRILLRKKLSQNLNKKPVVYSFVALIGNS